MKSYTIETEVGYYSVQCEIPLYTHDVIRLGADTFFLKRYVEEKESTFYAVPVGKIINCVT